MRRLLPACMAAATLLLTSASFAQTTFVSDQFTTAVNQTLESHTPNIGGAWTRLFGINGIQILAASDDIRNANPSSQEIYGNGAVPPANEYAVGISATFTNANASNFVEVFGRGNIVTSAGYLAHVAANGNVILYHVVSGTFTTLATGSAPMALNVQHSIVFSIRDSAKEIYVDGVLRASSADNTVTTVGIVGLSMNANGNNQSLADNFFAATLAPTAATFLDAAAVRDPRGRTLLTWSTAREADNLGFRIHRRSAAGRELLTREWIAGSAFLAGSAPLSAGGTYRWLDESPHDSSEYWIEEMDLGGARRWHGPFVARRGEIDERVAVAPTLTQLGRTGVLHDSERAAVAAHAATSSKRRSVTRGHPERRQWEIAAGAAVKISVEKDAWYRIESSELAAAGLTAGTDLNSLALFADGVEVPILIENGAVLFYGQPLDSAWSLARVYWLVSQSKPGKRIARAPFATAEIEQESYPAFVERRDKTIFFTALRSEEEDAFVGPVVSTDAANPTVQELTLTDAAAGAIGTVEVTIQGGSDAAPHHVRIALNDLTLGVVDLTGQERVTKTFSVPATALRDGVNRVAFLALGGAEDINAVVAARIGYERRYRAIDGSLPMSIESGRRARLEGFASPDVRALDITDPATPFEVPLQNDGGAPFVVASGPGRRILLAQSSNAFAKAASVLANQTSTLHDAGETDLVIIVHPSLAAAVEPLRAHRVAQGMKVVVAKTEDIYDEMSFGAKDPAAIRALLARSQSWQRPPRFVLLFGDASFDSRNYIGGGAADLVPTRLVATSLLRTASDSWLTDFDDDGVSEIAIGRLPARDAADAATMIGKVIAYDTTPTSAWTDRALIVRDSDSALDFRAQTDSVQNELPSTLSIDTVDVAATGLVSAQQQLLQELDAGELVVVYAGHGSVETWSGQRLFQREQALALENGTRLPFVIAMTCLNAYFHDILTESLSETWMRAPNGGAIAVWTSSGLTDPIAQTSSAVALSRALFSSPPSTFGEAAIAAQRAAAYPDVRKTFLLIGDPSMRLRR